MGMNWLAWVDRRTLLRSVVCLSKDPDDFPSTTAVIDNAAEAPFAKCANTLTSMTRRQSGRIPPADNCGNQVMSRFHRGGR